MEIICEKCGNRAMIPDEKIPDKPVKARCKKCGAEFTLSKPQNQSPPPADISKLPDGKLKVVCPNCNTGHVVDPEKIPKGKIKVKCRKCEEPFVFEAQRKAVPPPPHSDLPKGFLGIDEDSFAQSLKKEAVSANADIGASSVGLAEPILKKKPRDGYYIIDEDGNENGPLDIIALRNGVRVGTVGAETLIITPEGDNTVAGRMAELASAFDLLQKPEPEPTKEKVEDGLPKGAFALYVLAGAGVGLIFGLFFATLSAVIGPSFLPFATGDNISYSWKHAIMIIAVNLCFGMILGLMASILEATSKSGSSKRDEVPGTVGAVIGGLIGLIALLSDNTGMFGAIGMVVYAFVLAKSASVVRKKLTFSRA